MPDNLSTEYINTTEYKKVEDKLQQLKQIQEDKHTKILASRKLRYSEIDIEAEREGGRLQPDELYTPVKLIDTNIRREQSSYVQYVTQSHRAVITEDNDDPTVELAILDRNLTKKVRFDGWQVPMFACIDGFQANGYCAMEVVADLSTPGELRYETIQYGDFAFITDTKDIQAVEMTARAYYYTRTKLLALCGDGSQPEHWKKSQIDKVLGKEPESTSLENQDVKDKSLYKVLKVMFRVNGVVNVAWCAPETCDDWLRDPRPLFIGRRKLSQPTVHPVMQKVQSVLGMQQQELSEDELTQQAVQLIAKGQVPASTEDYEYNFPYVIYPYLISEDDTIENLKGRVFLDQDLQEAVSSLLSSTVTQARRAAGLYFSKDTQDPNDDFLLQKNIFFKQGCIINGKVTQFQLTAPDPSMFNSIQSLVTMNQNETSQVNFAAMNRKDSRKTAKEVSLAERQEQNLSTVQVVLFSIALTQMYRLMVDVIKSRVLSGLIKVNPQVLALYARKFTVKPSGDTDVIEKQQLVQQMMQAWPTVQQTPAATLFMCDLIELMFPDRAAKYIAVLQQAEQQKNSQQAQQQQQIMMFVKQLADNVIHISKQKEMFSEMGKLHVLPEIEKTANQIEMMFKQMGVKN